MVLIVFWFWNDLAYSYTVKKRPRGGTFEQLFGLGEENLTTENKKKSNAWGGARQGVGMLMLQIDRCISSTTPSSPSRIKDLDLKSLILSKINV